MKNIKMRHVKIKNKSFQRLDQRIYDYNLSYIESNFISSTMYESELGILEIYKHALEWKVLDSISNNIMS